MKGVEIKGVRGNASENSHRSIQANVFLNLTTTAVFIPFALKTTGQKLKAVHSISACVVDVVPHVILPKSDKGRYNCDVDINGPLTLSVAMTSP